MSKKKIYYPVFLLNVVHIIPLNWIKKKWRSFNITGRFVVRSLEKTFRLYWLLLIQTIMISNLFRDNQKFKLIMLTKKNVLKETFEIKKNSSLFNMI